jgi:hypothetical protein
VSDDADEVTCPNCGVTCYSSALAAALAALATAKGEVERAEQERDEANRQLAGNAWFRTGHPLTEQAITRLNGLREYGPDMTIADSNAILDRLEDLVRMLGFDAEHANDILEQTERALSTAKVQQLFDAAAIQAEWMRELYEARDDAEAKFQAVDAACDRWVGVLRSIAQYSPEWTGQKVNDAPSLRQIVNKALDALKEARHA